MAPIAVRISWPGRGLHEFRFADDTTIRAAAQVVAERFGCAYEDPMLVWTNGTDYVTLSGEATLADFTVHNDEWLELVEAES
jgi:hypothetical protein